MSVTSERDDIDELPLTLRNDKEVSDDERSVALPSVSVATATLPLLNKASDVSDEERRDAMPSLTVASIAEDALKDASAVSDDERSDAVPSVTVALTSDENCDEPALSWPSDVRLPPANDSVPSVITVDRTEAVALNDDRLVKRPAARENVPSVFVTDVRDCTMAVCALRDEIPLREPARNDDDTPSVSVSAVADSIVAEARLVSEPAWSVAVPSVRVSAKSCENDDDTALSDPRPVNEPALSETPLPATKVVN